MSKPVLQLAAVGVVGVIVWKLFSGVLLGVVLTVLKIVFVVALALLAVWAFKRWSEKHHKDEKKGEAPAE
jgi:membrane protein implicated in regulation of membrane protease activity